MKQKELQELLRHITRAVVNEYMSMTSTQQHDKEDVSGTSDPNAPPVDAMTPAEKIKKEREDKKAHDDKIKQDTRELDSTKKQTSYYKQQLKQNMYDIKAKQKELQAEKGAQI